MDNIGKNQLVFNDVFIVSSASVVGPKESKGPFGNYFDKCYDNLLCNNESSFEKAEMRMMEDALIISLDKANLSDKDINCAFCGDLNNQIIIGNYVLRNYDIPYVGIFGACSTSILGIIMGAIYLQNMKGNVICLTSSHNGTSERQFRYPNEYGAQKAETATLTVTGASSVILTNIKNENDINKTINSHFCSNVLTHLTDLLISKTNTNGFKTYFTMTNQSKINESLDGCLLLIQLNDFENIFIGFGIVIININTV